MTETNQLVYPSQTTTGGESEPSNQVLALEWEPNPLPFGGGADALTTETVRVIT